MQSGDSTLVTGAGGFLGAHVVAAAFTRSRAEATFADPFGPPVFGTSRDPVLAPRFTDPRDGAQWVAADLSEAGRARALLDELGPALVVHCAALARQGACEREPEAARRLNVELAAEIAEWCAARGARLVHVSTDLVFGERDAPSGGFGEDEPTAPVSSYGRTKADGERAVLERCPAALVARLPLLYGNSGGRGLGASDSLLEAVDRDEVPALFTDEWRTPLEVRNAADALVELAHSDAFGVLHVAGPDRVSRHTLGIAVLRAMGLEREAALELVREARREDAPELGPRPRDVSLDASRARALLDTDLAGVEEGLRRAMR